MFEQEYEDNETTTTMPTPEFTIQMVKMLGISVDDIKSSVIEGVKSAIIKSIEADIREDVATSIKGTVDSLVSEWVKDFMDKPFTPVNSWGEPETKQTTSIRAVIEKKSKDFLLEKVDSQGRSDNYGANHPRYVWAAQKVAEEAIQQTLRPELDKVIQDMKAQVKSGISAVVTELVNRNFK